MPGRTHDSSTVSAYGARRVTPQRRAIARAIADTPGAFTVEELAGRLRGADSPTGTATVYRAVASLEESGWIERVGERGGSALYTRCEAEDHHHHLVCTACGCTAPAECPVDADLAEAAARAGFVLTDHVLTLYGLCAGCRPAERGQRGQNRSGG